MEKWPFAEKPSVQFVKGVQHCTTADADAWLASQTRTAGFTAEVTVARLMKGEVVLLHAAEVRQLLFPEFPEWQQINQLKRLYREGTAQYMTVSKTRLFDKAWVERAVEGRKRAAREEIEYGHLLHLVGAPTTTIWRAVRRGDLQSVACTDNSGVRRITRTSLLALLSRLLPMSLVTGELFITPEEWIEHREISQLPLLSVPDAAERLGLTKDDLRLLLVDGEILYIWSMGGKNMLVSPSSLARYQLRQPMLTAEQKAAVFGADPATVQQWVGDGLLTCPLHNHLAAGDMYRWCLVAYLRPRCGPGVDAARWVRLCFYDGYEKDVWAEPKAAAFAGRPPAELAAAAETGALPAVRVPDGSWAYRASDVRRGRAKLGHKR